MVAAYLVATGMTPSAAWKAIRRRRPFIQPTVGQEARLIEFAAQEIDFMVEPEETELENLTVHPKQPSAAVEIVNESEG
jgi:hypothetical protein